MRASLLILALRLSPNGAHQARAAVLFQREDQQEIGGVQRDIQFAVDGCTARFHISNVEQVRRCHRGN